MAVIRSGATSDEWTIDPTSKCGRVTLYDTAGNPLSTNASPQPVVNKPLAWGTFGHYRLTHRVQLIASQAANSRFFELRNTSATNLIVPTQLVVTLYQIAAGTAQIAGLDIFKCTAFTAVDTSNAVTPSASSKRVTMAVAPGAAAVRGLQNIGATAGITGGTLTKDAGPFWQLDYAVNTNAGVDRNLQWGPYNVFDETHGTYPFVFAQNEGFEIENRTFNTTSFGIEAIFDLSWAEVTAF